MIFHQESSPFPTVTDSWRENRHVPSPDQEWKPPKYTGWAQIQSVNYCYPLHEQYSSVNFADNFFLNVKWFCKDKFKKNTMSSFMFLQHQELVSWAKAVLGPVRMFLSKWGYPSKWLCHWRSVSVVDFSLAIAFLTNEKYTVHALPYVIVNMQVICEF